MVRGGRTSRVSSVLPVGLRRKGNTKQPKKEKRDNASDYDSEFSPKQGDLASWALLETGNRFQISRPRAREEGMCVNND